ncbi:MAG: hypothetical protein HC923_06175 [Myxococcales bacterium]|nr:hypothetical protein [Myxococcales bacterium]
MVPTLVKGTANFADGSAVSFERNGALKMPNLPKLVINDVQAGRYEDKGIDALFYLRLINENPFGVVVDSATYEVLLDDRSVREGTAGIGIRLPQGSAQEFEVSASVDENTFGKDYVRYLDMSSISYRVRGQVVVEGETLPFEYSGTLEY